jgi:hypothetical protein
MDRTGGLQVQLRSVLSSDILRRDGSLDDGNAVTDRRATYTQIAQD